MQIDFAAEHTRYLKGRMENGIWVFTPVNPANPVSGIQLSTFQVFSNAGLGVSLYVRNDVDEHGNAIKVHAGLKLLFSHKVNNKYLLAKDESRITLTLDVGAVRHLYEWLSGGCASFTYDLVRMGSAPRQLAGFETDKVFPLTIRGSEFSPNGGYHKVDVGLTEDDIFHLQMHCVALAKLLYPSISDTVITQHLIPRKPAQPVDIIPHAKIRPAQASDDHEHPSPGPEIPQSSPAKLPDLQNIKRAVFAVGKTKWPAKDIQTIEYIQENSPIEAMDRLIKAGNGGDFSEWDKIHSLVRSGAV